MIPVPWLIGAAAVGITGLLVRKKIKSDDAAVIAANVAAASAQAAGNPAFNQANVVASTTAAPIASGVQVAANSPAGIQIDDNNFSGIIPGDIITVDAARQALPYGITSGNIEMAVSGAPVMSTHTLLAIPRDSRISDLTPRAINQTSITGITPGS